MRGTTTVELDKIKAAVAAGRLSGAAKIGVRVGKVVGKHKMAKHFDVKIEDTAFTFSVNTERVTAEAAVDGIYVIRTSVAEKTMTPAAAVLNYKKLAEVERAFRTLKGVEPGSVSGPSLHVRPIRASFGNARASPYLSQHARLLCAVAYAGSLVSADVR